MLTSLYLALVDRYAIFFCRFFTIQLLGHMKFQNVVFNIFIVNQEYFIASSTLCLNH